MNAVGVAPPRIEGPAKVTGAARYAADVPIEGVAFGVVVLAAVSRGRVRDIDVGAVREHYRTPEEHHSAMTSSMGVLRSG